MEMRVRIIFSKGGPLKFISHKDLMRLFERAFSRAALPVKYSGGFNPHPLISLPLPLALGMEGLNEIMEVKFAAFVEPAEIKEKLQSRLPEGLLIKRVDAMQPGQKSEVAAAEYVITFENSLNSIKENVLKKAAEERIERAGKVFALAEFLYDFEAAGNIVSFKLRVGKFGTPRIDEILTALGIAREIGGSYSVARCDVVLS